MSQKEFTNEFATRMFWKLNRAVLDYQLQMSKNQNVFLTAIREGKSVDPYIHQAEITRLNNNMEELKEVMVELNRDYEIGDEA